MRVSTKTGKVPVIFVAPHGNQEDDLHTDIITDILSSELQTYHIINTGWKRADKISLPNNIANLNNINHCKIEPIRGEFLSPLLSFKKEIMDRSGACYIFFIHGMSNSIRHKMKDHVDIVLGHGEGIPPSYTCSLKFRNALVLRLQEENFNVYRGKQGGRFSAWKTENLNQLFRQHYLDQRVTSVQLEVVNLRRYEPGLATKTALTMARAFDRLFNLTTTIPHNMRIEKC